MKQDSRQARRLLQEKNAACAVVKGEAAQLSYQTGIRPLLDWLEQNPDFLRGAAVADRVVGKAAAMLMIAGGVREIYAGVASDYALECLEQHGVPCFYEKKVPSIRNRAGTGMCPMEECCLAIHDPNEAHAALRRRADELRKMAKGS